VIRLFDFCFSAVIILILLPVALPIMIILRFTGEGEIFYKQCRIGYKGKKFKVIKFATMLKDSASIGTRTITVKDDPRVLPFGNFLRKSKINELPQIINILKGDMSFIGPRPLTDETFFLYDKDTQNIITSVVPGLSGIGSIIFRSEENLLGEVGNAKEFYSIQIAPYKASLERWYVERRSLKLNITLMFITIYVVLLPQSISGTKSLKNIPQMPATLREKMKEMSI